MESSERIHNFEQIMFWEHSLNFNTTTKNDSYNKQQTSKSQDNEQSGKLFKRRPISNQLNQLHESLNES